MTENEITLAENTTLKARIETLEYELARQKGVSIEVLTLGPDDLHTRVSTAMLLSAERRVS